MILDEFDLSAMLHTPRSRRQVARLFTPPTWSVRKCSWTDYEVTSLFAELVIEAESPILLNGSVADAEASFDHILALLRSGGIAYTAECYGAGKELLREFRWEPS